MGSFRLLVPVLVAAAVTAVSARANLIITPTWDSTITSDPNAAAIEGAINTAIAVFEQTYTNPIDVLIYFQEGGGLGQSNFYYYDGVPGMGFYQQYYNALAATDANPAAIAGLTAADLAANGNNSNLDNPVTGSDNIDIKSANARAVGIDIAPGCVPTGSPGSMICPNNVGSGSNAVDGIISLNTSITYRPTQPAAITAWWPWPSTRLTRFWGWAPLCPTAVPARSTIWRGTRRRRIFSAIQVVPGQPDHQQRGLFVARVGLLFLQRDDGHSSVQQQL